QNPERNKRSKITIDVGYGRSHLALRFITLQSIIISGRGSKFLERLLFGHVLNRGLSIIRLVVALSAILFLSSVSCT
ncbi:MAG: hypothetical protein ACK521_00485, partial [bacterium]